MTWIPNGKMFLRLKLLLPGIPGKAEALSVARGRRSEQVGPLGLILSNFSPQMTINIII